MNAPLVPTLPSSLWAATAKPAVATPPLSESTQADVAIVGAGYTGLVTALHLAEAGVRVCVLDAGEPGWGASGRNGGQVIPGLKFDPEQLIAKFGAARGEAMIAAAGGAADEVFALIERLGIDCDATRKGWIQPAASPVAMRGLEQRAGQWRARGVEVELLDKPAVARRIGSVNYLGGWVDPRAGSVQPMSYARGLARAAVERGAKVHGHSRVTGLRREEGGWVLSTAGGAQVRAERVLLAGNGYTDDLWPGLRQTLIAANSFIVATQPLPAHLRHSVLPGARSARMRGACCCTSSRTPRAACCWVGAVPSPSRARPATGRTWSARSPGCSRSSPGCPSNTAGAGAWR
ncbi:hypothetical protein PSm6_19430 [Pseudomonas solani]|uniref:FAD dependent oxidoreductase domain-containing protein n=1 Tax=Pseudomonas solani TaxID=2731552 RepID=A0ABM7L7J3_9PSED|nr:hypothetical protein PSm6_19430 [Pseudomonas solani]